MIVSGHDEHGLHLFRLPDMALLHTFKSDSMVFACAFNDDGTKAVAGGEYNASETLYSSYYHLKIIDAYHYYNNHKIQSNNKGMKEQLFLIIAL